MRSDRQASQPQPDEGSLCAKLVCGALRLRLFESRESLKIGILPRRGTWTKIPRIRRAGIACLKGYSAESWEARRRSVLRLAGLFGPLRFALLLR